MAHQTFALRLGSWFQKIIGYSGAVFILRRMVHILDISLYITEPVYTSVCELTLGVFCSAGFRQAFCKVALDKITGSDQPCLISRLMLQDARMFKGKGHDFQPNLTLDRSRDHVIMNMMISFLFSQGARKMVHDLIFCSMLLDNEFKRLFALEFTKVTTK